MTNDLQAIMPKILASGLRTLRETAMMPRLVNGDYSTDAAERGDTIDVPVPTAISTINVTPGVTDPTPTDITTAKVQVQLNNWKQNSPFRMTDKEMKEVMANRHYVPMNVQEAIRGLANDVNTDLLAEYKRVYTYWGASTDIPFNSTDGVLDATGPRKLMGENLVPKANRRAVVSLDAEANMLALPQFAEVDKIGNNAAVLEGEIGRKYGIDWYAEDAIPTHTAGAFTGTIVTSGAAAVGAESVTIATGSGEDAALNEGDIITFAGDTQTYVVTADLAAIGASATGAVSISPPLKVAQSGGEAVTLVEDGNTYKVNLVFHRDAIAFATRPLSDGAMISGGSMFMTMQDPVTGLVLRLETKRQHKQQVWEFDILWGARVVRPELAVRLHGST